MASENSKKKRCKFSQKKKPNFEFKTFNIMIYCDRGEFSNLYRNRFKLLLHLKIHIFFYFIVLHVT